MTERTFKFLNKGDVHHILEKETLRLGRQSYYRKKYEETGDEWIGDPREGKSTLHVEHMHASIVTEEHIAVARKLNIQVAPGVRDLTILDFRGVVSFDNFIFCASKGNLFELTQSMCVASKSNKYPYDACLEIIDMERFYAVLQGASFSSPMLGKVHVTDFKRFQEVVYTDARRNALTDDHDANLKRSIFAAQREVRMMFEVRPEDNQAAEVLYAKVPGLGKCMKSIF